MYGEQQASKRRKSEEIRVVTIDHVFRKFFQIVDILADRDIRVVNFNTVTLPGVMYVVFNLTTHYRSRINGPLDEAFFGFLLQTGGWASGRLRFEARPIPRGPFNGVLEFDVQRIAIGLSMTYKIFKNESFG